MNGHPARGDEGLLARYLMLNPCGISRYPRQRFPILLTAEKKGGYGGWARNSAQALMQVLASSRV
jgi:hypothetical protein